MNDPASWCKLDVLDAWPEAVAAFGVAYPGGWPRSLVVQDLRWWLDRVKMGREKRLPGRPTLAKRWGWKSCAVRKLLVELDPLGEQSDASRTPAARQPHASRTPAFEPKPEVQPSADASVTPAPRQPDASETPHARSRQRTEDRGQRTEEEQQGSVDPWAVAAEAWSAIRYEAHVEGRADPVQRRNEAPDSRTRGLGRDLAGIVKHYDLADVLLVFRWFEHAESAAYLRDSTQKRGLDTIRRHFEKYRNSAREWAALGEPGTLAVGEHGAGYDDPDDGGWESVAVYLETLHRFGQEPTDADIRDYLAECRSRGETPDPRFADWTRRVAP